MASSNMRSMRLVALMLTAAVINLTAAVLSGRDATAQSIGINDTGVASGRSRAYSSMFSPLDALDAGDARDAGAGATSAGTSCVPSWISTFGSAPGLSHSVRAMTIYDDGSGAGPQLYAAGGSGNGLVVRWNGESWIGVGSGVEGGNVNALAAYDGDLYAGGSFDSVGGVPVEGIAKWNGFLWSAVGSGTSGTVLALLVHDDGSGAGTALYVGGSFTTASGAPANRIARWDGVTWSTLGSGMSSTVRALAVHDDGSGAGPALYAAGDFTTAGGLAAIRIARWNGAAWSALGSGLSNTANALTVHDDGSGAGTALYACGTFVTAGGVSANRIARWDGSSWSALGSGLTGTPNALAVLDDGGGAGPDLYAAGTITSAGGLAVSRIARWDGSSWSVLTSGVDDTVFALASHDDGSGDGPTLFVGGAFGSAGGSSVEHLARWNGSSWTQAGGNGFDDEVDDLEVWDDGSGPALYIGGEFTTTGGVTANGIVRWDGTSLSPLGSGVSGGAVAALVGFGSSLYVGGTFVGAGETTANRVARWDGSNWFIVGGGMDGGVMTLAVYDDGSGAGPNLYAGGSFSDTADGPASRIARWNGSAWSALGSGLSGGGGTSLVHVLTVHDDGSGAGPALYAGGGFGIAGGVTANRIARWDGSSWSALGSGMNASVEDLAVFDDGSGAGPALYAAGDFTIAGGVAANHVARWNGSSWSAIGTGMDDDASALAVYDDGSGAGAALYVAGSFTLAGGWPTNVARWNGTAWSPRGTGFDSWVNALAAFGGACGDTPLALHAGGHFWASPAGDSHLAKLGCPHVEADTNGDGCVGFADLTSVLIHWGACPEPCDDSTCPWDIDGSCDVGFNDYTTVLLNWS